MTEMLIKGVMLRFRAGQKGSENRSLNWSGLHSERKQRSSCNKSVACYAIIYITAFWDTEAEEEKC